MQILNKKYRLFLVGSWLMAKLLWSFELSRLAINRLIPRAEVQTIAREDVSFTPTEWIYEQPFVYTMTLDPGKANFVFTKVSELMNN